MSFNGSGRNSFNNGFNGVDQWFVRHMQRFIGENVLVFTTSGGASGSGFSGILMEVNCDFIRLVSRQSTPPTCPISDVCDDHNGEHDYCNGREGNGMMNDNNQYMMPPHQVHNVGSICDIPIDRIAAFCHNAV